MNETWKSDPRLKGMDPRKLSLLQDMAKELGEAPENQKMAAFLSVNQRAAENHISFTPAERDLILSILTEDMAPEEKKRVQLIKNLAAKLSSSGRRPGAGL